MTRPVRAGADSPTRRLDAHELAEQRASMTALKAWTAYLESVPVERDFELAEANRAPLVVRHAGSPLYPPLAVCPAYAVEWVRGTRWGRQPGTGIPLTFTDMISALSFMRAPRYAAFTAYHDVRERRQREGYWRVTAEVHARLRGGVYVPSLATLRGRPKTSAPLPVSVASGSPRMVPVRDPDNLLQLLRSYLRESAPTALLATAQEQGRPLVHRAPGRPRQSLSAPLAIRSTHLLVHVDALAAHMLDHAAVLGMSPMSRGELQAGLRAMAEQDSPPVGRLDYFGTLDGGRVRRSPLWWLVSLRALGLAQVDPAELSAEIYEWRQTLVGDNVTGRESVTYAGPAVDPEWEHDPDYREAMGLPPLTGGER